MALLCNTISATIGIDKRSGRMEEDIDRGWNGEKSYKYFEVSLSLSKAVLTIKCGSSAER